MAVTGTPSNHYKYQRQRGEVRLKAQLHNVSLTFADATNKITLPSSAVTAGFEVGDRIVTNSANAGNQGPFTITAIGGGGNVELTVVLTSTGGPVAFTDGTENNLTIGTYLVKVLLMRSGFVFDKDTHATLSNTKGTTGSIATIAFVDGGAGNDSITDSGNGFLTAGFVVGNSITVDSTSNLNDGTYVILAVSAGTIEVATGSLTAESAAAAGATTITADDELATAAGYTQNTKLTGVITLDEDDTNDRSDGTFPTVTWTAAGGSIGPTPGAILYDDASGDNTILGYIDFDGEKTATDTTTFNIASGTLREMGA